MPEPTDNVTVELTLNEAFCLVIVLDRARHIPHALPRGKIRETIAQISNRIFDLAIADEPPTKEEIHCAIRAMNVE